jgi:molybdopterin-guanine dinucleotide biosynthesis protein A
MGTDEGLLIYKGKPFISHVYDAMKPVAICWLIVSSNADYDAFWLQPHRI